MLSIVFALAVITNAEEADAISDYEAIRQNYVIILTNQLSGKNDSESGNILHSEGDYQNVKSRNYIRDQYESERLINALRLIQNSKEGN